MQVGGELRGGGEEALAVLALGLAEELLPPAAEGPARGLPAAQQLNGLALAKQQVAGRGVEPDGVLEGEIGQIPLGGGGAEHELGDVHAGHGQGQQAHGGQHGVAAAHVGRDHKALAALLRRHLAQGAPGGIGGDEDALPGLVGAVAPLQHPFQGAGGDGGLGGGAGFGDDVDGEVLALQQGGQLLPGAGGEVVARKEDLRVLAAEVVVLTLDQLDGGAGTQIGAADAHHHKDVGVLPDPLGGGDNAAHLVGGLEAGQVQPAQIVGAGALALVQQLVGGEDLLLQAEQIDERIFPPDIGNINIDHSMHLACVFLSPIS